MQEPRRKLQPYRQSLAGTLLAAREAVMAPLRPMLRDAGVTEQQWRVLRVIRDSQPIDATALADAALLFGPSVTRIRETDPRDRRRSIVTLTPAGRALIEHTANQTVQVLDRYAERFGPERLEALKGELRALIDAIEPFAED